MARVRPVLEQLCRRIEHIGPAGAGATMPSIWSQDYGDANINIRGR